MHHIHEKEFERVPISLIIAFYNVKHSDSLIRKIFHMLVLSRYLKFQGDKYKTFDLFGFEILANLQENIV